MRNEFGETGMDIEVYICATTSHANGRQAMVHNNMHI